MVIDDEIVDAGKALLAKAVDKIKWTKTDYIKPHEYIVCRNHPALCAAIKAYIALDGYPGKFQNYIYHYIDMGEYYYWAFDTIVNRRLLSAGGNK